MYVCVCACVCVHVHMCYNMMSCKLKTENTGLEGQRQRAMIRVGDISLGRLLGGGASEL